MKYTLQYASNFFLNLHTSRDFHKMLVPVSENLVLLGNISSVDTPSNMILYDSFLEYVSNHWKHVYIIPGPYEYSSKKPIPFYDLYTNLTGVKHQYNNIKILNNSTYTIPYTDITLVGSTLWTEHPYYRLPYVYEFSYIHKYDKTGNIRQILGSDLKQWFHEDITHIKESIKSANNTVVLSHHLPIINLTDNTIKTRMEASMLEYMFRKKIPIWLGGAGNKTVSGTFGITKDTFCAVNTYTTFYSSQKVNAGYDSGAYVSVRKKEFELI